jgi:hypothetical protein
MGQYRSYNPYAAAPIPRAESPPVGRFHSQSETPSNVIIELGEDTKKELEQSISAMTENYKAASVQSLAASRDWKNIGRRQDLLKQSEHEKNMKEFGDSVLGYMRSKKETERTTYLASAHGSLKAALKVKPTPTEPDNTYTNMRRKAYLGVGITQYSNFSLPKGSLSPRTYFHAGVWCEFSLTPQLNLLLIQQMKPARRRSSRMTYWRSMPEIPRLVQKSPQLRPGKTKAPMYPAP